MRARIAGTWFLLLLAGCGDAQDFPPGTAVVIDSMPPGRDKALVLIGPRETPGSLIVPAGTSGVVVGPLPSLTGTPEDIQALQRTGGMYRVAITSGPEIDRVVRAFGKGLRRAR